ncbi:MAG: glutathione synthase [Rhodocyclaceae bacterium]|jgi:glutathione synthase|nr:glutathione synthase [Rhodocyclaceae bacterium]MBP7081395.1 glutathione synthase [Rhodocyclaceae bacterium]
MKLAFIVDPLENLKAYKDSSIAMMRAAAQRGHQVWTVQRPGLHWRDGQVAARALQIQPGDDDSAWFSVNREAVCRLTEFDAVLMRQDPPFDAEYVAATWLLDRAAAAGARIWNRPSAIRDHSEKVALAEFFEFAPTTLIASDIPALQAFIDELEDVVVKPLDGMGGSGIFRVRRDDPNRNAILETITDNGRRSIMAQRYLPEILDGDKRILLIGGVSVPFALARVPKAGELRGNLAAGGTGIARPLSARDKEIADKLAPILWSRGLLIVGLDVIGNSLTEINVTSPTCFVEIFEQTGCDVASMVIDVLERECAGSATVSASSSSS